MLKNNDKNYIIGKIKKHFYGSTFNQSTLDSFLNMLQDDINIKNKNTIQIIINKYLKQLKYQDDYYFDIKSMNKRVSPSLNTYISSF